MPMNQGDELELARQSKRDPLGSNFVQQISKDMLNA